MGIGFAFSDISLIIFSMKHHIILSVMAEDRPGLVETLSSRIASAGANWEESRMCRLGGQFAGILKVSVPSDRKADLVAGLQELSSRGFTLQFCEEEIDSAPRARTLTVRVIGRDHPGIIRDVSAVLLHHAANVEELHTELLNEPMSGVSLFAASMRLVLPAGMDPDVLRGDLESVASDLMVDLEFAAAQ
jgi:glycine cleavage system regulatory protein